MKIRRMMVALWLLFVFAPLMVAEPLDFTAGQDGLPSGWSQNRGSGFAPFGQVLAVQESGAAAVRLLSTSRPTVIMSKKQYPVGAGQRMRLQVKAAGQGTGKAGFYFYQQKRWIGTRSGNLAIGSEAKVSEVVIETAAFDGQMPDEAVVVLEAGAESQITFFGCEMDYLPADSRKDAVQEKPVSTEEQFARETLLNAWAGNARATMPILEEHLMPRIDGRIQEEEWMRGVKFAGFIRNLKGLIPEERGYVYLMTDKKYLYIAVKSSAPNNDPGAGLVTRASGRDSAVYSDDSVEFTFQPDRNPKVGYHLIINNNGAIYDRRKDFTGNDNYDLGWNIQGATVGTRAESSWWDFEVKIPLAEIGNPEKFIKMNIARNWAKYGPSALIPTGDYNDASNMFTLVLQEQAPVLRMNDLGTPCRGDWKVRLSADNPGNDSYILCAMLRNYTWPKVDGQVQRKMEIEQFVWKEISAASLGTELELNFATKSEIPRWLSVVLFNSRTKEVLFSRLLTAQRAAYDGDHPYTGKFTAGDFGSAFCWYYPGFNKVRIQFIAEGEKRLQKVLAGFAGEYDQAVKEAASYNMILPVSSQPGIHMLSLRLIEEGGQIHDFTNVLPIEKRVYGWENNTYGKEKIIIPPFIPVDASQNQISLLQRKHTVNSAGLWDSLLIQGREMLAAPMFWKLSVDGHDQVLQGKTPGFSVLDGGCSAEAVCVAQAADGTVLKSSIKFEYDGFFWSEVTLDQVGGKSIDRLTLVIPLKDAEVPLFHAIANTIRSNPGGSLPPGEGEIWNGAKLVRPSTSIHPQLVPHIWLGGIERGLAWFVDTSFGFRIDRKNSALRIIRKNDTVFLEIDVINRKVMLSDQHRFAFGMQATPVKPVEKEWRRIVYDAYGNGIKGMINAQCLNEDMLGYYFRWSKEPAEGDFSLLESMARIARGDDMTEVAGLQEQYRSRHDPKWLGLVEATPKPSANQNYLAHFKSVRTAFVNLSYGADHIPSLPYKYSDPRLISMMDEVPQYFQSEWWINNTNYFGGWRSYPVPSNIDYMVYGYYHEIKHGMQGVYMDDMFIIPCLNLDTVAKFDPEGEVHSQLGILALRELVKRVAVIQHQFKRYPRILQIHMTNAQLIPCFAFATSQLAWEALFGESPLQERYTLDNVQAEGIGRRLGVDSLALGGILRKETPQELWQPERERLSRTFLSMTLPHEVKVWNRVAPSDIDWKTVKPVYEKMNEFGYWRDDCEFIPYWENHPALRVNSPDVILSAYVRPGEIMLIVSNMKDSAEVSVSVDYRHFKLAEDSFCVNLETGEQEDLKQLRVGKYDFKLVKISRR